MTLLKASTAITERPHDDSRLKFSRYGEHGADTENLNDYGVVCAERIQENTFVRNFSAMVIACYGLFVKRPR